MSRSPQLREYECLGPRLPIGNLPKLRDVARQVGDLAGLPVALAVGLDLVHLGGRDFLREDEGLGHVVIVILHEIPLATQNWVQRDFWG